MTELLNELNHVLFTSYPVSLKNLDNILKTTCKYDVRLWAESHSCQTTELVRTVLGALELCPYALSVLEHVGHVTCIRDDILRTNPALLHTLLRSALQDENNFDKYSHVCLALLSTPLPQEFSPPAQLVPFFLRCVECATKNATVDSIRAVYTLVSNGFGYLSGLLSSAQRHSFNRQMAQFLTIQGNPDTNVFLIMALATLAHMASATESVDNVEDHDARPMGGITDFFMGKRALKVLTLVTNIVIELAARDCSRWENSTELIQMTSVIVEKVADNIKQQWRASKEAVAINKVLQKAQRPDMDKNVATELLKFVLAIHATTDNVMPQLQGTFDKIVQNSLAHESTGTGGMFLLPELAVLISTTESKTIRTGVLRTVLNLACSDVVPSSDHHEALQSWIQFLQRLRTYVPNSQNLRRGILATLVTNEVSLLIEKFVTISSKYISTPASTYEDGGTCLWNIHGSTKRLCVEICALILQSGFYSHHDETVSLDPHLASLLMNIQISHSGTSYECPRKQKVSVTPYPRNVSLFEASATPEACMSSRNWRQTLIDRFSRETDRQYGFVVAAVGEICRDLENRCEGIEKPLRDEQEITNQLRAEVLGLKSRSTDLEDVIGRQNIALEESMRDNDQLRIKLNEAVSKAQKCTDRVEQLEELVEVARQDAKQSLVEFHRLSEITALEHRQALNAIRDSADRTAMENMTVLNERQDNIDQLIETRHQLEENLERQKMEYMEETTKLQGKNQKLFEKIALLEKELTQGLLKLQAEKAETLKRNDKIEELEQGLSEIEEEDEKLRDQLRVSKNIVQELEAKLEILGLEKLRMSKDHIEALQNLSNEHATKVDQLQMVHERHVETLAKQKVHDDQTHSDEMHKLRETLNKNCLDWTHERESLQSENRILAKSIHKLQTHQEQKEKEAQVLTRQLLGLMTGGGSDSSGFTHLLTSGSNSSNNNNENCSTSNLPTMTTRRKSFSMDGEPVSKRPKRQSHPTVKPIIQQHLKSTGKSSELCEVTAAFSGSAPTSEMYEEETQKDERELCDSNGNSENETHHFDTNTSTKQSELMPEFEETMDF